MKIGETLTEIVGDAVGRSPGSKGFFGLISLKNRFFGERTNNVNESGAASALDALSLGLLVGGDFPCRFEGYPGRNQLEHRHAGRDHSAGDRYLYVKAPNFQHQNAPSNCEV